MKIRLRIDLESLIGPKGHRRSVASYGFRLNPNQTYTVYGIIIEDGYSYYVIMDEMSDDYPMTHPYEIFEIIDSRESQYWVESAGSELKKLSFREWTENERYYEYLVEGRERESLVFRKYRRLMDDEFRNECLRRTLSEANARLMPFDEGETFIQDLKDIYGERLHNLPLNDLSNEEVWKSTDMAVSEMSTFPNTSDIVMFFDSDVDSRVYLLDSLSNLQKIMSVCPAIPFSLSDVKKEFLLSFDGDFVVIGSGLALAWDFWDF